jgi:hypothetical protein
VSDAKVCAGAAVPLPLPPHDVSATAASTPEIPATASLERRDRWVTV